MSYCTYFIVFKQLRTGYELNRGSQLEGELFMFRSVKYGIVIMCVLGSATLSEAKITYSLGAALGTDAAIFAFGGSKLDKGLGARPRIGYEYFLDVGFREKTSVEVTLLSASGFSTSDDYMDRLSERKTKLRGIEAFYSSMKYWMAMNGVSLKHHYRNYGDSKIFLAVGLGLYKLRMEAFYAEGSAEAELEKIKINASTKRSLGMNVAASYETPITDFLGLELFTRFNILRGALSGYNTKTMSIDKFIATHFLPFFEFKARLIYHNVYF